MRRFPVLAALTAGSALCLATDAAAQDTCDLLQSRSSTVQLTGDGFFNFISDPVFGCEGGIVIRADSAVLDDVSGFTRFVGNFEYRDSTAFMTADRADHFASEGRLIGVGNVHIIDGASGATFEGDSTVLVGSSSRREDGEMTLLGLDGRRAHAVILVTPRAAAPDSAEAPPDSAEAPSDSAVVEGDSAEVADSAAASPDSAAVESDPTEAADSTETPPEAEVVSDSALAGESTEAAAGAAVEEPGDSTTPTDSTRVGAEPSAAATDSAAVEAGEEEGSIAAPPPPDTTPVPYDIDAERIYLSGADYMLATGNAELYNEEFRALADSIEYRETAGMLFLRGTAPRVFGYGAEYVLSGNAVDLDMDGNQVTARGDAALSGSEIDLTAPEIRVLMMDGVLDRIVAMNERPPETEVPGLPGEGGGPPGDSAAAARAGEGEAPGGAATEDAGEAVADETPEDAGEPAADETPEDAGIVQAEQAGGDLRAEPTGQVFAEATPSGEESALGEAGAPRAASGETADSAEALPPARPRAVAETFELEGDSIDVLAPNEVLEQVVAVGSARGESLARDSLNTEDTPEIARSDWVYGDTIIAVFRAVAADTSTEAGAQAAAGEQAGGYQLDRLVARGEAASLYRLTPSGNGDGGEGEVADDRSQAADEVAEEEMSGERAQGTATEEDPDAQGTATEQDPDAPEPTGEAGEEEAAPEPEPDNRLALHYVRGDLITIFMQDGEVTSVIVEGSARGVQLEPLAAPPPPDTVAAPSDTTAAPPATRR